jgi:hypothetical protein
MVIADSIITILNTETASTSSCYIGPNKVDILFLDPYFSAFTT